MSKKLKPITLEQIKNFISIDAKNERDIAKDFNEDEKYDSDLYFRYKNTTELYYAIVYIQRLLNHHIYNLDKDLYKDIKDNIINIDKIDYHVGCFSYPNCKEAPRGCHYQNEDFPETYGHRG